MKFVDHPVVMVPKVEEELLKEFSPVQVLLLERSVEEAAVMVMVLPAEKRVPLMVPSEEVETNSLLASVAMREEAERLVRYVLPVLVNWVVEAWVKKVVEAMICAFLR